MTFHLDLLEFYRTDKWHVADHTIDAVNGVTIQSGQPTPIFQDNRMQVYARGSNNHLLEFYRTDKWYCVDHSNETGGVTIEGDPTPIFQDNRMQVYARGSNNHLLEFYRTDKWYCVDHSNETGGVTIEGDPTPIFQDNRMQVYARGSNNHLLEFYRTDKWYCVDHSNETGGVTIEGDPTPIFQDNRMQVYARGSNNHLLEFYRTDKWYCVDHSNETGGVTIEGDPTPIFQDNRMQVYARGSNNHLLEFYRTDKWYCVDHSNETGGVTIEGDPTPIFQDNRMQVYARGSNNHLLEFYRTDKWYCVDHSNETGGVTIEGDPTPIFQDNRMQVYSGLKISTKGFADIHNHQFANLGFGGRGALFGSAFGDISSALPWCTDVHGPGGTADLVDKAMSYAYLGSPRAGHLVGGNKQFDGWPRWNSFTHQSVYEDWLWRAWQGGLRLMVMHAVNSEFMTRLVTPNGISIPSDMEAVDYQIQAAYKMQTYIDNKNEGPGKGWYRIVKTPDEAQAVIDAGKLAVVLGIEVDYLFGSYPNSGLTEGQVKTQLDKYYQMGVRHIFPIHFSDNAFGGASFDKPLLQYDTNIGDNDTLPDNIFHLGLKKPYKMTTQSASGPPYTYTFKGGRMNVQGLTNLGKYLIRLLMAKGMIVDIDHTSFKSRSDILDIAESHNCPVISGHTGFVEISNSSIGKDESKRHEGNLLPWEIERIRKLGGMVAVIPHQGNLTQINNYVGGSGDTAVYHSCGNSSETLVQAYLYAVSKMKGGPVGFGTDLNGFAGLPGPRFGKESCPGNPNGPGQTESLIKKQVSYPFIAAASGVTLGHSVVGQKTFDYNFDGLAHMGMLPDLIADFKVLGLTDQDLSPLINSAQGYIDVWRKVTTNGPMPIWTSLGGTLTSEPAVSSTIEGSPIGGPLDVFVRGTDGLLYHRRQLAVGSIDQWTGWAPIPGLTLASDKTVTVLHGVQVFAVGSDNKLYTIRESSPGSNQWTNWTPISGTKTVTSEPVIGRNQNNKLTLFARDADGGLLCLLQTFAGGSQWKVGIPPPGNGRLIGKPTFALTQDVRMAVFVRGTDNKLYCTVQGEVNVNDDWSNWFPIDTTGTLSGNPVVGKNMDSTLEVFVKGTDNALYHVRQSANTFVWGHWEPLGGFLTSDPVVGKYTDGTLDIVVRGRDNKMYHKWQITPGNRQWTEWVPLGGSINGKPSVATSRSMMLDVFARGIGSDDLRYTTILPSAP